jgi:hypothetical protein
VLTFGRAASDVLADVVDLMHILQLCDEAKQMASMALNGMA